MKLVSPPLVYSCGYNKWGKWQGKAFTADRQLLLFIPFKSPICNDQPPREELEAEGRRRGGIEFLIVQHFVKKKASWMQLSLKMSFCEVTPRPAGTRTFCFTLSNASIGRIHSKAH